MPPYSVKLPTKQEEIGLSLYQTFLGLKEVYALFLEAKSNPSLQTNLMFFSV